MPARVPSPIAALSLLAAASGGACLMAEARVEPAAKSGSSTVRPEAVDRCAPIDKLDLLLMVDNSNFMTGAQTSLAQALPRMLEALTTGTRRPGRKPSFPPVKDVHVGVVSSDMGIAGVDFAECRADGGDDGRLKHAPRGEGCDAEYPQWLSFGRPEVDHDASDLGCLISLGTTGCGYEQSLESPFKALMPKRFRDQKGVEVTPNPFRFISTRDEGTWGRGDVPEAEGGNAGFLRPALEKSPSLVVVLVVTDEDDCSVRSTEHLKPAAQLADDSPYLTQDINLRCFLNKEFLYDVEQRYYSGLRWLRPAALDRVMFAAIAGVPPDLVDAAALSEVDFDAAAPDSRQAFYADILDDERMQETVDPDSMPGAGRGNLRASCTRQSDDQAAVPAYPPRRIVELAKLFDRNGMIQSICQTDFNDATDAIVDMIARKLKEPCAP